LWQKNPTNAPGRTSIGQNLFVPGYLH
jgi:hypothetical protein